MVILFRWELGHSPLECSKMMRLLVAIREAFAKVRIGVLVEGEVPLFWEVE